MSSSPIRGSQAAGAGLRRRGGSADGPRPPGSPRCSGAETSLGGAFSWLLAGGRAIRSAGHGAADYVEGHEVCVAGATGHPDVLGPARGDENCPGGYKVLRRGSRAAPQVYALAERLAGGEQHCREPAVTGVDPGLGAAGAHAMRGDHAPRPGGEPAPGGGPQRSYGDHRCDQRHCPAAAEDLRRLDRAVGRRGGQDELLPPAPCPDQRVGARDCAEGCRERRERLPAAPPARGRRCHGWYPIPEPEWRSRLRRPVPEQRRHGSPWPPAPRP